MRLLETVGHRGHGSGRTLVKPMCAGRTSGMHEFRPRKLPDGTMTGGNQPTNIRGIDRRRKVPMAHCLQESSHGNGGPRNAEPP